MNNSGTILHKQFLSTMAIRLKFYKQVYLPFYICTLLSALRLVNRYVFLIHNDRFSNIEKTTYHFKK